MARQLAWIGLGNMGRGMSKNLAEKGKLDKPLILYNRTTSRATELSAKLGSDKTVVASSVADVVRDATIIFTCLGNDAAINSTIDAILQTGPDAVKGKLLVDCSTVHPDTTDALFERVTGAGARFVACPVFGAPAMAEAGQLIAVPAGAAADVEEIRPYLTGVMSRAVVDFPGEKPGKASLMKLLGNSFVLQMVEALAQGHTVAEKSGLGTEKLHQFISLMFPGPYTLYSTRMMSGDYYNRKEPLFAVDLAIKDVSHVLNLAESSGARMKAVEVGLDHLKQVKAEKGPTGDLAGIYGAVRMESGLPFDNGTS